MLVNVVSEPAPRPYRSDLRRQRAEETRRRVIEAAVELFGTRGYRGTTFVELARRAGVSVETVRKQGTKAALLQAAIELMSFGVEGETDVLDTDLGRALAAIDDPDRLAEGIGAGLLAINAPSAGLWTAVVGAAHDDPEVAAFRDHMLGLVRRQVERILSRLAARGWLRTDVPFDDLVEAFCVVTSVESYVRFVRVDRRSDAAYAAFVARTVRETILSPRPTGPTRRR